MTPDVAPPGVDLDALGAWFSKEIPGADAQLQATLIPGGRSNLTYVVTDGAQAMDLHELSDRQEIADLLTLYTRAVDTRSFAHLADVFTADAVLDYSAAGGPVGTPGEVVPWIEQGLAGFQRSQHILGQLPFTVDDADHVRVTAYFTNPMVALDREGNDVLWEVGGYYHHEVVRTPDGWRSAKIVDDIQWTRGF